MAKTFVFRTLSVDLATLQDGLACIFNNHSDTSATIDIRRIRLIPVSGQNATGAGTLTIDRISAISGGDDVAVSKHDTASDDLPAEVLIRSIPNSVTITETLRRVGETPMFNSLLAGACIVRAPSRGLGSARTHADDLFRFPTSSNVERIILREGEGLAICEDVFSVPHAGACGFCIRDATSGACYTIRSRDVRRRAIADLAHIAVFNGSGSGVVLEIFNIQYPEEGEAVTPTLRIAKITGYEGGTEAPDNILKFDTETNLDGITAIEGPFRAKLMGEDNGVTIDWHTRHGVDGVSILQQQKFGVIRNLTYPINSSDAGSAVKFGIPNTLVWEARGSNIGIVARPGEGVAILAGRAGVLDNSTFNCYQVEMIFNYNAPVKTKRTTVMMGA